MLRIERMEVVGFKSFPERTVVDFPDGVTAVVGPNGSGKSNIVDAISWVLGEQSARALRGGRMEDVIFAGTEGRGPGGMAEVTLELSAREDILPGSRTKVTLTRRLYRTGDSEYLMDGRPTRLADIRGLLEQVRAGERTYAIVDQGRVGSFVTSKPRERRQFIEDAAGIASYRQRRRLAEMKLEATKANLLRVDDILREVERQRRSLQRQASLARRARRLDEELRGLKTLWYGRRSVGLERRTEELSEFAAVAQREGEHLEAERSRQARVVAEVRARLEASHAARTAAVDEAHRRQLDEERLAAEIEAARARAGTLEEEAGRQEDEGRRLALDRTARVAERDSLARDVEGLDGRLAALAGEVAEAEARAEATRQEHRALADEATRLERGLYESLHQRAEIVARLSAAREALTREGNRADEARAAGARIGASRSEADALVEAAWAALHAADAEAAARLLAVQSARQAEADAAAALDAARRDEAGLASELDKKSGESAALASLAVRLAGADSAREALERAREVQLEARGVVADALEVDPEVERAAEAFLSGLLPGVVVDGEADVLRAAGLGLAGRVNYLPLDAPDGAGARPELPGELLADPRVRGRLAARVRPRPGWGAAVWERVEDAILVDDLPAALELHRRFPRFHFLTPEGHAVHRDGIVAIEGRATETGLGLLARARRRDELGREVEQLSARREQAAERLDAARNALEAARAARAAAEEALAEARGAAATAKMTWEQSGRDQERLAREAVLIGGVLEAAERGREEAQRRAESLEGQVTGADEQIAADRLALEAARERVLGHEDATRGASLALAGLLTEVRAQEERRAGLARELERMTRELDELAQRSERGLEAGRRALADAAEARQRAQDREVDLERTRAARVAAEAEAAAGEARLARDGGAVREAEARLDTVLQELEEARARREHRATEFERSRLELERLVETCREELGVLPGELPAEVPQLEGLEMLDDDEALAGRIADARARRERVGPVNPLAEQEYEELSARFELQSTQKQDLEATIAELNNSIKKMDRESKERFSEAFVEIRRHFREQFALLFRGGKADLLLEDESNPLESGVEIVCQPPGKKLQSVTLLSGGEKALAATAVLFAIFRYAPPPFCLLDEVDAPLDDANVGRFADALRGFADRTQFIVITHNKRSMEMADLLYGVTMAEPGVSKLVSMTLD
jgi:chromosome segregation protein